MICPILSQSRRDTDGNVTWDHHDCIEDSCTFWAAEVQDCGIRASGLATIASAKATMESLPKDETEILKPFMGAVDSLRTESKDQGLKLLEGVAGLEEPLKATGRELGERLDSLNETLLGMTTTVEGRISRLEEHSEELSEAVKTLAEKEPEGLVRLEESVSSSAGRLEESMRSISRGLEESTQSAVRGLEELAQSTVQRLETMESDAAGTRDRIESTRQEFGAVRGEMETMREGLDTARDGLSGVRQDVAAVGEGVRSLSDRLCEITELVAGEQKSRGKDEAAVLNSRGVGLYYRGALEAAESTFRAALKRNDGLAEAHNNLGLTLSRQGRAADAEDSFRKALEIEPDMAEAMNNLGFLYHQGMQFEKAADLFRQAAMTSDDASVAYTNLGNACYKLGNYTDAVDAWKKALDKNPLNERAKDALRMFQQDGQTGAQQ